MEDSKCTICQKEEGKPLKIDGENSGERVCPAHVKRLKEWLNGKEKVLGEGKGIWTINGETLGPLLPYQEHELSCLILDLKREHGTEMDEDVAEIENKVYENLTKT